MNTHGNDRKEVLSTINAVLPEIVANPEKHNIKNYGHISRPKYLASDMVKTAFEIAEKVQEELDKRTV